MAGERTTSRTRTGFRCPCRTTVTRPGTGTSGSGKSRSRIVSMLAALAILLASDSIPAIVPRPAHVTPQPGAFTLRAGTVIVTDRALRKVGELLRDYLFPATGLRLGVATAAPAGTPAISIRLDSTLARLGDEGYRLDVSRSRVAIRAYRAAGAFYGIETLRQLLPPAIFRQAEMAGVAWSVPGIAIEDLPRFAWPGRRPRDRGLRPRALRDDRAGDRDAGSFPGRHCRVSRARQPRRHPPRLDGLGRGREHPQSRRRDRPLLSERADGSDGVVPGTLDPYRRRRGAEDPVEGEPARTDADSRARAQGRRRAAELVHAPDGRVSHRPRPHARGLGRDPSGWARAQRGGHVLARRGRRHRGRPSGTRRGHGARIPYLLRSLSVRRHRRRAARDRGLPAARHGVCVRARTARPDRERGATCARGSGTAVDRIRPRREASGVHGVSQGVRPRRGAVDTAGRAGLRRLHQAARHTSPATGRVGRQLPSTRELRAHHCENRPCDPRSRPG
ncbi:MAG: hypothetical protein DMD56_00675 [Gemmatimonadetes bacterium]|nr:MAG: hypothetical protein DMD56_00675 [Gemmatimonadota bacterium]